jgi:hypothetical protein
MSVDNDPLTPGGTPTPTPEPGSTIPADPPAPLKPIGELLGKKPGDTPDPQDPPSDPQDPKPAKDTAEARIRALTAEKWQERRAREAAELRAQHAEETIEEFKKLAPNAAPPAAAPPAGDQKPPVKTYTQKEMDDLVAAQAATVAFNRQVDDAVIKGRSTHADFDKSVEGLKTVTGNVVPQHLVEAILEAGENSEGSAELIYQLGKDTGELDRILSLPKGRVGAAVARYATKLQKTNGSGDADNEPAKDATDAVNRLARRPQAASPPITPRVQRSGPKETSLDDPNLPMQDFIRRRNEEELAARQARKNLRI